MTSLPYDLIFYIYEAAEEHEDRFGYGPRLTTDSISLIATLRLVSSEFRYVGWPYFLNAIASRPFKLHPVDLGHLLAVSSHDILGPRLTSLRMSACIPQLSVLNVMAENFGRNSDKYEAYLQALTRAETYIHRGDHISDLQVALGRLQSVETLVVENEPGNFLLDILNTEEKRSLLSSFDRQEIYDISSAAALVFRDTMNTVLTISGLELKRIWVPVWNEDWICTMVEPCAGTLTTLKVGGYERSYCGQEPFIHALRADGWRHTLTALQTIHHRYSRSPTTVGEITWQREPGDGSLKDKEITLVCSGKAGVYGFPWTLIAQEIDVHRAHMQLLRLRLPVTPLDMWQGLLRDQGIEKLILQDNGRNRRVLVKFSKLYIEYPVQGTEEAPVPVQIWKLNLSHLALAVDRVYIRSRHGDYELWFGRRPENTAVWEEPLLPEMPSASDMRFRRLP